MTCLTLDTVINAPPAAVYKVLMDFEKYPEWNPMVIGISGQSTVGSKLNVEIKFGDRKPMSFQPTVSKNDPNVEFAWSGKVIAAFLYSGTHYFRLSETDAGTLFTHGEEWSGILVKPVNSIFGDDLPLGFEKYNQALKARVESTL